MNNALRSELLAQTKKAQQLGFKGSIMDVLSNPTVLQEFTQQQNRSRVEVASTPQQQQQGLSGVPANQMPEAMVFPNVKPNTSFNTEDMLASINIEKYDNQGHLVKSYDNVPPGITNLPMGPQGGTVIETPANVAQSGGRKKYQSGARGESMDYIEPKTLLRINTDRQGNITNTENQPASKTTALDPKRFFSIWNNSPMYRQMMQGKEQDLNVNTPDSNWNTYMTAAESENRLNAVLSPDPYNYTEYTKNNPLPNLRPNFEGLVEAAKERGAAGENITDFRNYNLQNLSFKSLPDYASGSTMAAMSPGKGDIMVKSSLSENLVGPAIVHELSHMQDMHIRDLNNPKNSIISIGPRYGDHFRRLYRSEDSPMILDSTISESGVPLMPRQDYKKIRDYSRANERVLPESYGVSLPSTSSEEFTTQKEKNKIDFAQYVTHPSETRARLNATRYEANKIAPNLWNPFYQSMTPEILNELKLLIPDNEENLEFLNLRQLLNFYTDEQIIDMFNSISMHEDASSSEDIPKTQSGGIRKYQSSSPTEYFEQKPLTSSDFDYTTDRSRGNARFFGDPVTGEPFPLVNLPEAEVVAQRTPYNQLSNQSLLAGVSQAKPWFEAGNKEMGYEVLKKRKEDLERASFINEFTGIPAMGRTADRVQNDPADLFTFEGGLDMLGFVRPLSAANKGAKALAKSSNKILAQKISELERGVDPSYIKDLVYSLKRKQFPTFKTATRWEPDEIPEFLKKASSTLTEEQKAFKGAWYGYPADGNYFGSLGFYPTTRPGPGNLHTLRLSNRQIDNLEKSMPAAAKGMSGKTPIPSSDDYFKGELIIPEELRKKTKAIRMDVNPSEYGPSFYANTPLENMGPRFLTGKFLDEVVLDPVNNLYLTNKLKIPKKYIKQSGGLPGEFMFRSQSAAAPLAYNSPTANGYLLPDPNRPELMNTGATEYKMGVDDVTIPTVVNGNYMDPETAYQRYKLTGEKFKPTADPSAYSKFYDEVNKLGIMKYRKGGPKKYQAAGSTNPPKEQSYLSNLYNTSKKYLSPFVSEISEEAQAFIADKWPSIKNFGIESAKDLTGTAFDAIVSPPKVDEETGKKAEPSFYDNWVYAPIRNMSTSVLPSNIVALKQSMEGIETPLENSFFPSSELQDIYSLVKRAKADGRNYVTYTDYNPAGNVMEQKSVSGYIGNQEKVRTTLGQFTFEEDPETGVITIKDTYDFNPSTLDAHNVSKFTKEELSKKKPSELLDLGYNYYINQGKNEATAMYLSTRYWVAPYHAKGNPPVNLTLNPEDYKDAEADRSNQTTTPNVGTNEFRSGGKKAKYKSPKMY